MIVTTASNINYPVYLAGKFSRSYIVFGVVTYILYYNYDTYKGDNDWDGGIKNKECLEVRWVGVPVNGNADWGIPPPLKDWVRMIRKAADVELSGMNKFMKD